MFHGRQVDDAPPEGMEDLQDQAVTISEHREELVNYKNNDMPRGQRRSTSVFEYDSVTTRHRPNRRYRQSRFPVSVDQTKQLYILALPEYEQRHCATHGSH